VKTPLFAPMLAPAATPLALRLNVSAFAEPSVTAAMAVNVRVVPTAMFVSVKGNVREGAFTGVTAFVTITVKVMELEFPGLSDSMADTVRFVVPTCAAVGVQEKVALVMPAGVILAPTGHPPRGKGSNITWSGEVMSLFKTETLMVRVVPTMTFVGLGVMGLSTIGVAPRMVGTQANSPPSNRSIGRELVRTRPRCGRRSPRSGVACIQLFIN
jgi:hypothetical protein